MTVRIDTLHRELHGTRGLLLLIEQQLDELHAMSYERHVKPGKPNTRVQSSVRDYALDDHGDPVARAAYRDLTTAVRDACSDLAIALHTASSALKQGKDTRGSGRKRITEAEHCDALAAAARRVARGEATIQTVTQPAYARALHLMEKRALKAERRAEKLQRKVDVLRPKASPARRVLADAETTVE